MARRPLLLAALEIELAPLLSRFRRRRVLERCSATSWLVRTPGGPVDIRLSGPGRENVLETLAEVEPSEILHVGFAGALVRGMKAGDVRCISSVRCAAQVIGLTSNDGARLAFDSLPAASIVTVPGPASARAKAIMAEDDAADLVDMETWVVVSCCREEGIPYTGVRVVSDALEDEIPKEVRDCYDGRRFRTGRLVRRALVRPRLMWRLIALGRASRAAAERLADVIAPRVLDAD